MVEGEEGEIVFSCEDEGLRWGKVGKGDKVSRVRCIYYTHVCMYCCDYLYTL